MLRHCKVTGKICYAKRYDAEIAADKMALRNWHNGLDTEMDAYPCPHCESIHVGTRFSRPAHPWKACLHQYKHLPNPRPRPVQHVATGNLNSLEKTYDPRKRPNLNPRPRRNRSRGPAARAR